MENIFLAVNALQVDVDAEDENANQLGTKKRKRSVLELVDRVVDESPSLQSYPAYRQMRARLGGEVRAQKLRKPGVSKFVENKVQHMNKSFANRADDIIDLQARRRRKVAGKGKYQCLLPSACQRIVWGRLKRTKILKKSRPLSNQLTKVLSRSNRVRADDADANHVHVQRIFKAAALKKIIFH
jgi:hypothetical protein